MSRELLVIGTKTFKITIPDEAKITFGPWSPGGSDDKYGGRSDKALNGTLRVYANSKSGASVLAVFSGVTSYRDLSIDYTEQVAKEEGAVIWKSDKDGYSREEKVKKGSDWVDPLVEIGDGK